MKSMRIENVALFLNESDGELTAAAVRLADVAKGEAP